MSPIRKLKSEPSDKQFCHILVPVDFSSVSRVALTYGVELTRRLEGRLMLLHVVESFAALAYLLPEDAERMQTQHFIQARRLLPALLRPEDANEVSLETRAKCGDVVEQIAQTIEDERIDLVVMGTHGRSILARSLIGSTTYDLLTRIKIPIFTVCHVLAHPKFDTILLVTDLSEESRSGVRTVLELAKRTKSKVTLLHALEVQIEGGAEASVYLSETRKQEAFTTLQALKKDHPQVVDIKVMVAESSIADTILEVANELKTDIIAISTDSPDLTAEDVIRGSHVPVLCSARPQVMSGSKSGV